MTDVQRRKLFDSLVRELGADSAEILMEMLPPIDWSDVARRSDITELRGEMQAMDVRLTAEIGGLRGEMQAMDGRLTAEMGGLRGETGALAGSLRGEIAALGGEVQALGSRLDAQFAKLVAANLFTSAALAALIGAAVRLFGG